VPKQKMKQPTKKIAILFLISITFSQCSKKEEIKDYTIPQEYKDWFFFQPRSYWIYQRNHQNLFDTLKVDSAYIIKNYQNQMTSHDSPYYYEYLKVIFAPNFINLSFDHMTGLSVLGRKFGDSVVLPLFNLNRNYIGMADGIMDSNGNKIGSTEVLSRFSSLKIGNNTFQNVMVVQVKELDNNKTINFYLVKNIGTAEFQIIENNDTTFWTLNKWQIKNN